MVVYVLVNIYIRVYDETCDQQIKVFENIEDAQKQMQQEIIVARTDFEGYKTEEYVEGDMSWSIWEKGKYMSHHCDITINECEIQ